VKVGDPIAPEVDAWALAVIILGIVLPARNKTMFLITEGVTVRKNLFDVTPAMVVISPSVNTCNKLEANPPKFPKDVGP